MKIRAKMFLKQTISLQKNLKIYKYVKLKCLTVLALWKHKLCKRLSIMNECFKYILMILHFKCYKSYNNFFFLNLKSSLAITGLSTGLTNTGLGAQRVRSLGGNLQNHRLSYQFILFILGAFNLASWYSGQDFLLHIALTQEVWQAFQLPVAHVFWHLILPCH